MRLTNLTDRAPHAALSAQGPVTLSVSGLMLQPGESADVDEVTARRMKRMHGPNVALGEPPGWHAQAPEPAGEDPKPRKRRKL